MPVVKFYSHHIMRFLFFALCLYGGAVSAQFKLKGYVYDSSRNYPMEAVTVITSSGKGAITNAEGYYEIEVTEKDSVWFSYLGKPTIKYAVSKIYDAAHFDISLHINIPVLKEVIVRRRNYRLDSIQNRLDYEKAFNFRRPNLESMTSIGPMGAGIDINELIKLFQFRKNKSMESFRERLLEQEREKYIDFKFNKALVRRLTGLSGADLDSFMIQYRPSYEFLLLTPEYDFQAYIKKSFSEFQRMKKTTEFKKEGF